MPKAAESQLGVCLKFASVRPLGEKWLKKVKLCQKKKKDPRQAELIRVCSEREEKCSDGEG